MLPIEIRKYSRILGDFFFPVTCGCCRQRVFNASAFCENCLSDLKENLIPHWANRCSRCSRMIPAGKSICVSCASLDRRYLPERIHSLFSYQERIRALLLAYKVRHMFNLKRVFAKFLSESSFVRHALHDGFTIVPVPSRTTSFSAISLIAKELQEYHGIPYRNLLKNKAKKSQKTLSRLDRLTNLENNIIFHGRAVSKVLLLDDILTTGSTAHECVKVLGTHGAQDIRVCVISSVPETINNIAG